MEAELKKSGVAVDFSQLSNQIKYLQENQVSPKSQTRYLDGEFVVVEDSPEPPHSKNTPSDLADSNTKEQAKGFPFGGSVPAPVPGKPKIWTSLFTAQAPSKGMKLEHFPDMQRGSEAVAELDESDVDTNSWNHCLVGYFLDGKMPYKLLCATARAVWKENAPDSIKQIGSCFFFEFKDEATKLAVLEGGPYFFSKRYLVLTEWKRMLVPTKTHPSSIPAWVKLHKLPLECWTASGFSRIASTIGRPIHVDQATATKRRLDFARICIEISAGDELPDEVLVKVNGEAVLIRVEYQWIPTKCSSCKVFGHKCTPKQTPNPAKNMEEQNVGADISSLELVVQCKVIEALNKGGSAALDVATKVVPKSPAPSSPKADEVESIRPNIDPDPDPPSAPAKSFANPSCSSSGGQEDISTPGGEFIVVPHKKKPKKKGNQGALHHSKGR